jgi:hypothetical protein
MTAAAKLTNTTTPRRSFLTLAPAVDRNSDAEQHAFHRALASFNARRLDPSIDCLNPNWEDALHSDLEWRILEGKWLLEEREAIADGVPDFDDADRFVEWFEALRHDGPGQHDPLFLWLAEAAPLEAMVWFLTQEVAGEAGFDDLVALSQVKIPSARAKLELARNYWDEMGQGKRSGMHGPMLDALAKELSITATTAPVVWQALALGNLMAGVALNRRWAYHSIGALGVIELTAPDRAAHVNAGLKRLGINGEARRYFALHATLDIKHSRAWNKEVLHPLVSVNPKCAHGIAEGALMRLEAGRRCFDRYRQELGNLSGPAWRSRRRSSVSVSE